MSEPQFEGVCSSSWAITVASVANDVICAANKANKGVRVSYQNIIECCSKCSIGYTNGCYGGNFVEAMDYLVATGAVTGNRQKDSVTENCKNYKLKECYLNPDNTPACEDGADFDMKAAVGVCDKKCDNAAPKYEESIKKIASKSLVASSSTGGGYSASMLGEINNGNVLITEMVVFEDLYAYKAGDIYVHLYGRSIGTVTVAIIGFGVDNGTSFWWVRVPWGEKFGDKGVIKVQKGTNNCGIESPGNSYFLTA